VIEVRGIYLSRLLRLSQVLNFEFQTCSNIGTYSDAIPEIYSKNLCYVSFNCLYQ
jgi:hypothetical protein